MAVQVSGSVKNNVPERLTREGWLFIQPFLPSVPSVSVICCVMFLDALRYLALTDNVAESLPLLSSGVVGGGLVR